jgi:hypothetical protein
MSMNQEQSRLFYQEKTEKGMEMFWLQLDPPTFERETVSLQDGEFIGLVCLDSKAMFVLYTIKNDTYLNRYFIPKKLLYKTQISGTRPLSEKFRGDYIASSHDLRYIGVSFYLQKESSCDNVIKIYDYENIEELAATRLSIPHPEGKIKKIIFAKLLSKHADPTVFDILVAITEGNFGLYVYQLKAVDKRLTLSKLEGVEGLHSSKQASS